MKVTARSTIAAIVVALACAPAWAQPPTKSTPLVKELITALEAAKLDNVAAKDPAAPGVYIAVLYLPGVQLWLVSGEYSAPQRRRRSAFYLAVRA